MVDDMLLSEFVSSLADYENAFLTPTIMEIIDMQNIEAIKFHRTVFTIFLWFNFLPLLAYCVLDGSSITMYWIKFGLLTVALVTQLIIALFEVFQFKNAGGLVAYIQEDPWNLQDMFHCITFISFYIQQYNCDMGTTSTTERSILISILSQAVIVFAFIKILFYLRIYEEMGALVQMLITTIGSMGSFMLFLTISILFFAFSFDALGISYAGGDYKDIDDFTAILIQTFRNSIGDIAIPDYSGWKDSTGDWQYKTIMFAIWTLWFMNLLINLIILLNFLIAVISQVYDQVIALQMYCSYKFKADFNAEYFVIKKQIKGLDTFLFLVLTQSIDKEFAEGDDVNLGIVNNIKRNSAKQLDYLRSQINKSLGAKIDSIVES